MDAVHIQRLRSQMFGSLLVGPIPRPASCFYMEGSTDKVVISWAVGLVQFIVASLHLTLAMGAEPRVARSFK